MLLGLGAKRLELLEGLLPRRDDVRGEFRGRGGVIAPAIEARETGEQVQPEAVLVGIVVPDLLEDLRGLAEPARVHEGLREVVAQFAHRLLDRDVGVLVGLLDVAELDELLHRFGALHAVEHRVRRMHAALAGHVLPALDGGDLGRLLEDRDERLAVHVAADGKSVQREDRRAEIEHARAGDLTALADAWALRDEDAVGAVLDRRPRGLDGDVLGTQVVGMEAVVGEEDHRGVLPGEFEHRPEHQVVHAVARLDDAGVDLEVRIRDALLLWRVVLHEAVAEVVDAVQVHRHEVPRLELHERGRGGMDRGDLADDLGERLQALVLLLIDLVAVGDERPDVVLGDLDLMEAELLQVPLEPRRMHRARRHRPLLEGPSELAGLRPHALFDLLGDLGVADRPALLVPVAHHHAVDGLGRMARPPADDDRLLAALVEDVPDRLHLAADVRDRADALAVGRRLAEAVDAVLEGPLAGRDRGPQHRAEDRRERRVVPADTLLHHPLQVGHLALFEQRSDRPPVRGIPSDDEHLAIVGKGNRVGLRLGHGSRGPGTGRKAGARTTDLIGAIASLLHRHRSGKHTGVRGGRLPRFGTLRDRPAAGDPS